jgi:hypothetical protein
MVNTMVYTVTFYDMEWYMGGVYQLITKVYKIWFIPYTVCYITINHV